MNIRYKKRKTTDPKLVAELSNKAGISLLAADLLLSNGIASAEEAFRVLNPGKGDFLDPFLMPDMRAVVERLTAAVENGERIVIYGDYDCDGVCAAAILYCFLREKTETFYYIPARKDGYGLSVAAIDKIAENAFPDLIITVDCGVASAAEVEYAKELGIDVIITDHHTPQEILPDALILNPKVDLGCDERRQRANDARVSAENATYKADDYFSYGIAENATHKADNNFSYGITENATHKADSTSAYGITENATHKADNDFSYGIAENAAYKADNNAYAAAKNAADNDGYKADNSAYNSENADLKNSEKSENSENSKNAQNADIENPDDSAYNSENTDVKNSEKLENAKVQNHENSKNAENAQNPEPKTPPTYAYKNQLCGAGVALKLVEAMGGFSAAESFLDVAAIATVGDVVPLTGENRAIVAMGLKALNSPGGVKRKGLKRLCAALKLEKITASDIAFTIAPRLNAAGRMGIADRALELLISEDYFDIDCLIKELNADNQRRQAVLSDIVDDVYEKLLREDLSGARCIVLADEGWDGGVLGIACSKIAEQFNRPVILFTENDGLFKGSARSIGGVNIYEAIAESKELFAAFGGHAQAAGLSLKRENLGVFKRHINDSLKKYDESLFAPEVIYDAAPEKKPSIAEIKEIAGLEPFGEGNPRPAFLFFENGMNFMRIKGTRHIRERSANRETVGFNMLDEAEILNGEIKKAVLTTIEAAEYGNAEYLKSVICGFYAAEPEARFERAKLLEGYLSAVISTKRQNAKDNNSQTISLKDGENNGNFQTASLKDGENDGNSQKTISSRIETVSNPQTISLKSGEIFSDRVKFFDESGLKEIIKDTENLYGTAFVAFDDKTAVDFYRLFNRTAAEKLLIFCYRAAESKNPYNRLILSPKDIAFEYYKRVVFLDKPFFDPSEYTAAEVFAATAKNPLDGELKALNLSDAALKELYIRVRSLIRENENAESLRAAYAKAVNEQKFSYTEFTAAFLIFVELNLIKTDKDFRLALTENKTSLENSTIYKIIRNI
jgi:single-stranded-DNA-specific exonuclease RecJ